MERQRQRIARARSRAMARNAGIRFRRRFGRSQLPRRRRIIPPPPPPPPPFPEVKDDGPVMNMNDLMGDGKKSLGSKLTTVYEKRDKSYLDNRKHLGKYGYVDLENKLYQYDESMIKYTDDYDFIPDATTEGNTILEGNGPSLEGTAKCSEYESCGGLIYDRINRKYILKDKSMYPYGRKQYSENKLGLFVRKTQLDANKTCPKELRNVTGNIWEKTQPLQGTITSPDELCGIYKIIERDYERVNYLETKIRNLINEILNDIRNLSMYDTSIGNELKVKENYIVSLYNKFNESDNFFRKEGFMNCNNIYNDKMMKGGLIIGASVILISLIFLNKN